MGTVCVAPTVKELEVFKVATLSATAGTTNGNAVNVSGATGRALVVFSASALGAGNTSDADVQSADDAGFTVNVTAVDTYAVGTDTIDDFDVTAANTATFQSREIKMDGIRKFVRARVTTTGATIAGAAQVVLIAGGYATQESGGQTF